MDIEAFQDYLKGRYLDQIHWYDSKAIRYGRRYTVLQSVVIVFSAFTPVLVLADPTLTRWPAAITSVLVAIGTTVLKAFKYQENWINYRTTCETLKKEIYYHNARVGDYEDAPDAERLFVERVESLISRENTIWLTSHRPKERDKKANSHD